jgi:hypothetical protein
MGQANDIVEGKDPTYSMPMMDTAPMAMTKGETITALYNLLENEKITPKVMEMFNKAHQVIDKGIPKGALEDIDELSKVKPWRIYRDIKPSSFDEATGVGGAFHPSYRVIDVAPGQPKYPERTQYTGGLDDLLAHEYGHTTISRLFRKLSKRYGVSPQELEDLTYLHKSPKGAPTGEYAHEAWADILGNAMKKKSGLGEIEWGNDALGFFGKQVNDIIQQAPVKNVYLLARRWIEQAINQLGYPTKVKGKP